MELKNKTIVITGGSSGIGHALSGVLCQRGAKVYSFDINNSVAPVAGVTYLKADVTDSTQITDALCKVSGPIDVLVNNAGVICLGNIFEAKEQDITGMLDFDLKGSWLMLKHAKPYFSAKPIIVQMSAQVQLNPSVNSGAYVCIKKAVFGLTELLELTCPEYSVKVVYPGAIDTPLLRQAATGEGREKILRAAHSPEHIAGKIAELLESDKKKLCFDPTSRDYILE
jgi:NAD(P)-dependent dehydrogenase (short-subunit alcohol dehydrogenase family)